MLRRNSAGLLGFNVQQDGVITEVETYGLASQSGLRQGARIVEVCYKCLCCLWVFMLLMWKGVCHPFCHVQCQYFIAHISIF